MKRFLALLAVAACGEDHTLTALPVGVIQGSVREGTTLAPIPGATVSLHDGTAVDETTTDGNGRFVLRRVPAGSVLALDFAAKGYATSRLMTTVDDAAGESPQDNSVTEVLVRLWPNTDTFTVTVRDGSQFPPTPVGGITVVAADVDFGEDFPGAVWLLDVLQATTGSDGVATLTGVAERHSYRVWTLETGAYEDTVGFFSESDGEIDLIIFPQDFDACCAPSDPCFVSDDGTCDCPSQPWDACDCETCDGNCDFCCDASDPCGWENDSLCDCQGCLWDASDCP
jgi:hypothetical protein